MEEARHKRHVLCNSLYKNFLENDIIQQEKATVVG